MNLLFWPHRIAMAAASRWRRLWFRTMGVELHGRVWLRRISIPRQWSDISLGTGCALDDGVVLLASGPARRGKITIGEGTYINRHTMLDAHERVAVGCNCMIGPGCYITDGDHGVSADDDPGKLPMQVEPVVIEDGVWLGAHVVVLRGVTIGRRAVVGAGAVVTHNVAPGACVVGVPAKPICKR